MASGFAVTTWRLKDGLPSDRVRRLLQDSTGYLWVVTFNGVARFDGVRFRHYHVANTPELANNLVNTIYEDRSGRIWFGHETGDISYWEQGRFHTLRLDDAWRGSPIDHFAESRDGTIVALNRKRWFRALRGLEAGPIQRTRADSPVSHVCHDEEGQVWMVDGAGIFRLDPNTMAMPAEPDVPYRSAVRPQLFKARGGGIWVAGTQNIRRIKGGKWTGEEIVTNVRARTSTNTWIELKDGTLAASTLEEGLVLLPRKGPEQRLNRNHGLPTNYFTTLLEDREGNLWVGAGDQGLCRLRTSLVQMVAPPGGWKNRAVEAVVQTRDGAIWAGTEGDGVFRLKDGVWTQFKREARLPVPVVKALAEDREGKLWIGLANGSLGQLEQDYWRRIPAFYGISAIFTIFQSSDGRVWAGGMPGAFCIDGDRREPLPKFAGTIARVCAFAETSDRSLWIASLGGGLGRLKNGVLEWFRRGNGLPSDFLWSLHASSDDTLWIGTYDRGLVRLRNGRFSMIDASRGLPGNMVGQILEDEAGFLWLGTNSGIARVARQDLDACAEGGSSRVEATVFDQSEGLASLGLAGGLQSTACRARDGTLWFGTALGLARIDPRASPSSHSRPPVVIEAVRIDGAEIPLVGSSGQRSIVVPAGSRRLEIDYTGLSLSAPQRLRFRYRLEGAERGWTEAEAMRTAYFGYLRPGKYQFQVQVSTVERNPAASATIRIKVEPFFWETTWFAVLVAGSSLLLVAGVVYVVQHSRHRRRLEQIARQQAIERDRTRIAHDLHDEIGSGLTQLSILSHAALSAAAQPEKAVGRLREIQETTNEMTEAIDEIVWAVNPKHDSLESLLTYLGRVVQEFAHRAGLQCHIDVPLDLGALEVTPEYRHELYLAMREALNNVSKHADASALWFSVRREGDEFRFRIEDNGKGFSGARPNSGETRRGGVGLESMASRLARLGGQFSNGDRPEGGARIEFRIRLRPSAG